MSPWPASFLELHFMIIGLQIPHAGIVSCVMIKKIVRVIKASFLAGLVGVLSFGVVPVGALGFGEVDAQATLGESLDISLPLRLNPGDQISADCLAADVFFGDSKLSSDSVSVSLTKGSKGDQVIRVRTRQAIQEPVFTVYVVAGCQVRMTRKLVGFADPPDMRSALPQVQAAVGLPAAAHANNAATSTVSMPVASAAASLSPLSNDAKRSVEPKRSSGRVDATTQKKQTGSRSAVATSGDGTKTVAIATAPKSGKPVFNAPALSSKLDDRAAQSEGGARLELDPAVADAMVEPSLALSLNMGLPVESLDSPQIRERRQVAAALWVAMNASPEQLAKDRVRMQELESRLARLQQDAVAASKQLQEMEVRVKDAEARRFMHPFVYALVGACLLLLAGLAWMFLRSRDRQENAGAQWWDVAAHASTSLSKEDDTALSEPQLTWRADAHNPAGDEPTEPGALWTTPSKQDDKPLHRAMPEEAELTKITLAAMPDSHLETTQAINLLEREPVREMTVEELIDLEQQAEFFVVLGQDGAAVELLEGHVASGSGASPLPCLKLLEIYKRLDRRDDYERVQKVFNERFNGYAPTWDSNLQQGLSLEDYPGVVERIQTLWRLPKKAMGLLQQSILRPNDSTESFELPAYRELLMLYAIVRDLSDRQMLPANANVSSIDGLMTTPAASSESDNPDSVMSPLMATRALKIEPTAVALAVDLTIEDMASASSPPANEGPLEFIVDPESADQKKPD